MYILIIDVETSGLPVARNANYKDIDKYKNARIVQLSYMICDAKTFEQIDIIDHVIKADGFNITNSQFHWVTDEISAEQGIPFSEAAFELAKYLPDVTHILAHNADFDINIIKSELFRNPDLHHIIEELNKKTVICTMKSTMNMVNVHNKYGIKFPSLTELYAFVFNGQALENAHNAKYDVIYLHKAIKELYDGGRFSLQLP